ncbi:hypothetical protein [Campylobacter troglodytis]|uniref:hypothetical protein n=1 Tax=Campylobacter troglodytis TaxID=654363 RepID=UPI001FE5A9E9|nr:hypothetical protein [Campylobacter troglodytis]
MRAKLGLGAGKKTQVFLLRALVPLQEGMLKRNGQVYTQLVKAYLASELLAMGFKWYEEDGILVLGYL